MTNIRFINTKKILRREVSPEGWMKFIEEEKILLEDMGLDSWELASVVRYEENYENAKDILTGEILEEPDKIVYEYFFKKKI
tara:strand:- start:147 stop:392 length:246 start_codon:yes stop_codon:yes gene_type:complete